MSSQKLYNLLLFCSRLSKELLNVEIQWPQVAKNGFWMVRVKLGIHAVCLRTQAVGIKAPLSAWSEGTVLVRKFKNLKGLSPILFELSPKNVRGGSQGTPLSPPHLHMVQWVHEHLQIAVFLVHWSNQIKTWVKLSSFWLTSC